MSQVQPGFSCLGLALAFAAFVYLCGCLLTILVASCLDWDVKNWR